MSDDRPPIGQPSEVVVWTDDDGKRVIGVTVDGHFINGARMVVYEASADGIPEIVIRLYGRFRVAERYPFGRPDEEGPPHEV